MRNTIRVLVVFVSMCLCLSIFPVRRLSADTVIEGQCGQNAIGEQLYYSLDSEGTLTFSGSGPMMDFASYIKPFWQRYSGNITKIAFAPDCKITYIGNDAFAGCTKLTDITIPKTVTKIGEGAFYNCRSLESITIPGNVKTIGKNAFECCEGLKSVTFSYGVTTIGEGAFAYCESLKSVSFPKSLTTIGSKAFEGCESLTKVTGGAKLKTIGSYAFYRCDKLSSFTISSSVLKKIGSFAFSEAKCLKTLNIKKTTKLTKSGVKNSLKGSAVKTVKVKKSKVKKYKKFFKKSNSGRSVKVKK